MTAETVHVSERARDAAIAHDDRYLVQCFRQLRKKIPVAFATAQPSARIAFDRMIQIGELQRVAQEEYRRVVAHQIPISFFRIKLHRKAADVAFGIGGASFSRDRREAGEQISLFSDLRKDLRPGVRGDVVRDGKCAEGARALCVHPALRDDLAVEVSKLLKKPDVFKQRRAACSGGLDILVVNDRSTKY